MSDKRTRDDFLKDYRFTAVLGSLKIILQSKSLRNILFNANGTVSKKPKNI